MAKRNEKERNWHDYDQAQMNEIADKLEPSGILSMLRYRACRGRRKERGGPRYRLRT
ncbi:MAG: hypothetical protein M1327_01695 [Candidatus Thermoplasmatota archaeon]|nr:hypothetical protein [Candidatus Thermoplasmatota archaeon]